MCIACALLGPLGAHGDETPDEDEAAHHGPTPFPRTPAPFPLAGDEALGVTVTWTGVAGFVLEREGTRIAFDPFTTRPGLAATLLRRPAPDPAAAARWFSGLDAVFVGHTHFDHALDLPVVAQASPRARLVGGRVTVELCRRLGLPPERLVTAQDGLRLAVGPFTVEAVAAEHGRVPWVRYVDRLDLPEHGLPRTPFRYPRGEVLAWRVETGGRALYLQGSAGLRDHALLRQGPVDVLVACLAARRGTPRYLERLGERLRPRVLVPCHHDNFFRPLHAPPAPIPTLRWPAFLEEARALEAAHGTRLWRPALGVASAW